MVETTWEFRYTKKKVGKLGHTRVFINMESEMLCITCILSD